jgi:TRAP-type C4-dicarboxylate transport system permease small subunit
MRRKRATRAFVSISTCFICFAFFFFYCFAGYEIWPRCGLRHWRLEIGTLAGAMSVRFQWLGIPAQMARQRRRLSSSTNELDCIP